MTKEELIADKILRELRNGGSTYGEMLKVIRLALEKLESFKRIKK